MDGVKQQIQARQLESLENKHLYKVKKIKRDMRAELDQLRDNTQAAVSKVKSGYERKVMDEKLDLEKKLTDLRKKNEIMLQFYTNILRNLPRHGEEFIDKHGQEAYQDFQNQPLFAGR